MSTQHEQPSFAAKLLKRIPVVGYAIRCLENEQHGQIALLAGNIFMAALLAVLIWGYPAFITIVLSVVAVTSALILLATRG